jgi:hypothetical protein
MIHRDIKSTRRNPTMLQHREPSCGQSLKSGIAVGAQNSGGEVRDICHERRIGGIYNAVNPVWRLNPHRPLPNRVRCAWLFIPLPGTQPAFHCLIPWSSARHSIPLKSTQWTTNEPTRGTLRCWAKFTHACHVFTRWIGSRPPGLPSRTPSYWNASGPGSPKMLSTPWIRILPRPWNCWQHSSKDLETTASDRCSSVRIVGAQAHRAGSACSPRNFLDSSWA